MGLAQERADDRNGSMIDLAGLLVGGIWPSGQVLEGNWCLEFIAHLLKFTTQ